MALYQKALRGWPVVIRQVVPVAVVLPTAAAEPKLSRKKGTGDRRRIWSGIRIVGLLIIFMYYQLGRHAFVRNVNHSMLLWDKYNDNRIVGDEVAFIFAKSVSYQPKLFDDIIDEIVSMFSGDVDRLRIQSDAESFYKQLEVAGMIFSGNSEDECRQKAASFRYGNSASIQALISDSHQDEFLSFLKTPALTQIMVEITKICNERCLHCYIPHRKKTGYISYSNIYDIVRQCEEIGTVVDFKISGGECMTHPDFKKIISLVKSKGFSLTVLTNLTLLDDEIIDILKNGTLSNVQVSLFSLDSTVHDSITTKPGSLEKTLNNLCKLKEAEIPVSIATQIMDRNKDSIEGLYEYCEKNGFRFLCDWTIIAREDGSTDNLDLRVKEVSEYKRICRIRLKHDSAYLKQIKELIDLPVKSSSAHLCNAGMNTLQIDTELNIHPCPGWDINIGNLREVSIKKAWEESPVLDRIRKTVLGDFHKCSICEKRNICHICMAEAYNENGGKFEMPEYECQFTEILRETIKNYV